jgi:hypothetical protein
MKTHVSDTDYLNDFVIFEENNCLKYQERIVLQKTLSRLQHLLPSSASITVKVKKEEQLVAGLRLTGFGIFLTKRIKGSKIRDICKSIESEVMLYVEEWRKKRFRTTPRKGDDILMTA